MWMRKPSLRKHLLLSFGGPQACFGFQKGGLQSRSIMPELACVCGVRQRQALQRLRLRQRQPDTVNIDSVLDHSDFINCSTRDFADAPSGPQHVNACLGPASQRMRYGSIFDDIGVKAKVTFSDDCASDILQLINKRFFDFVVVATPVRSFSRAAVDRAWGPRPSRRASCPLGHKGCKLQHGHQERQRESPTRFLACVLRGGLLPVRRLRFAPPGEPWFGHLHAAGVHLGFCGDPGLVRLGGHFHGSSVFVSTCARTICPSRCASCPRLNISGTRFGKVGQNFKSKEIAKSTGDPFHVIVGAGFLNTQTGDSREGLNGQ